MNIYYFLVFIVCFSLSFCKTRPKPVDLEKFSIENMMPDNALEEILSVHKVDQEFLLDVQIEQIIKEATKFNPEPVSDSDVIIFETSYGDFEAIFFNNKAPKHCFNFKKLANSGFYDNTKIHRVITNFMFQGGDILSRDSNRSNDGTGGPGWTIDAEFNDKKHVRGTLSMARSKDINSAGSQFFICFDSQPHLDNNYTVFGQLLDLDNPKINSILDQIATAQTDSKKILNSAFNSIPKGENFNDWILLKNPKNGKTIYYKVPIGQSKNEYKSEIRSQLRSNNPVFPIVIKKIRVINKESE